MKNINLKFKKLFLIFLILFSISFINTSKTYAGVVNIPAEIANLAKSVASYVKQNSSSIKQYLQMSQELYNTYQSSKALIQQVKNAKLSDYAQNIGSDQILNYGQMALNFASQLQGDGINVLNTSSGELGRGQIVTNLGNYLDKIGANELRKSLSDLDNLENTNLYSTEIKTAIKDFAKNVSSVKEDGVLITFTLPYIARNEICNDPKLKNIIKNGEPIEFTKPKPAVANVDIDKLCDSSAVSIMSAEDQATFVGLAKAGYGGEKTENALRDPANSANGVITNTLSRILSKKEEAEETTSKQVESTGLNIGQQTCFDKEGNIVKDFDKASGDKKNRFCYSTNSSVEQSGSMVKDRTAAALLSPYFSMLARAQATNNKTKECADVGGYSGGTTGIVSGILKDVSDCVSAASNIMNKISTVLNIDSTQLSRAYSGLDSPYGALVDSIDEIIRSQNDQYGLYAATDIAEKQYQLGYEGYTLDDLKSRVALYSQIREHNTQKLNTLVFTYTILRLGLEKGDQVVLTSYNQASKTTNKSMLGWLFGLPGAAIRNGNISRYNSQTAKNLAEAVIGFKESIISLSKEIRTLIKEMARNNYTEQQMNALLNEFKNTENSGPEDPENQKQIADLLNPALTEKDFSNMQLDWSYVPEFEDGENDPTAPESILDAIDNNKERAKEEARQSKALIPPASEKEGPFTEQTSLYLRIRAWKVFKKVIDNPESSNNLSTLNLSKTSLDLLSRYAMTTIKSLNPNIPRGTSPNVKNILDPNKIKAWDELTFCNNLGLTNNICNSDNISALYNDYINSLNDTFDIPEDVDAFCSNINSYVEAQCSTATGDLKAACQDPAQKAELVQKAQLYCAN